MSEKGIEIAPSDYSDEPCEAVGKTILKTSMNEHQIELVFDDLSELSIWDDAQYCCEHRYLHTDDDLQSIVGQKLVSVEQRGIGTIQDESSDEHEISFVHIKTNRDTVVIETHNEHNGYYGGFKLRVRYKEREE